MGVVGDVRTQGPMSDPGPEFYLPMRQAPGKSWEWSDRTMTLVVRRSGQHRGRHRRDARGGARGGLARVPLAGITTLEEALRASTAAARFRTLLLAAAGHAWRWCSRRWASTA